MRKEVSVTHDVLACDVCGRTILKGERTEPYLVQDGSRRQVCELCMRRAESAGWIREAAHADMPATPPGDEPRPSLFERFRSRWRANDRGRRARPGRIEMTTDGRDRALLPEDAEPRAAAPLPGADRYEDPYPVTADAGSEAPLDQEIGEPARGEAAAVDQGYAPPAPYADQLEASDALHAGDPYAAEELPAVAAPEDHRPEESGQVEASTTNGPHAGHERGLRRRLRDPRHVRAVPTNAEVKVERALEVFNYSDHRRTVEGLVRTLGEPWVTAVPVLESTSEVIVVVAWELSWYQYRVDLGDSDDPVVLTHKGKELSELDVTMREWNAVADAEGALALAAPRSG